MTGAKCTIKLEMLRVIKKRLSNGVDNVLVKREKNVLLYASDFDLVKGSTLEFNSVFRLNEQV